jgi:ABC-2 type transport system permease protein
MSWRRVLLLANLFWKNAIQSTAFYMLLLAMAMITGYAAYSGWQTYRTQNTIRLHYQQEARQGWENNPDKHPHRMAHYGAFAFRLKHPLSMFDVGMESYAGNAVFLEAHKQNTVNFSEASFSTGLLRFGEISLAMILQIILPLVVFFLGFAAVAVERENGTLKVLLMQGVSWGELLVGKSLGLMSLALLFFIPVGIVTLVLLVSAEIALTTDTWLRYLVLMASYLVFFQILCVFTVLVSATSRTSNHALMKLLAIWLVFFIVLPKTTQAMGGYVYRSPSKIEFETTIEKQLVKEGDSHNPDDPHYVALKDSVLRAHGVDSVHKLPFNYSGFVMREGERISSAIYTREFSNLLKVYEMQNSFSRFMGFVDPYAAIHYLSMALSGTGFESYIHFQKQAEAYRYQLAQKMNELQMRYISNVKLSPTDKPYTISHEHWKEFPDFNYRFVTTSSALRNEYLSITALLMWSALSFMLIVYVSKKVKTL